MASDAWVDPNPDYNVPEGATLKVGFPPKGSEPLDLKRTEADITVGVLMTLRKLSDETGVPLHPDVEVAVSRIEDRLRASRAG